MIKYKKIGLTEDVVRLLKKLPEHYAIASIMLDIENKFITIHSVSYDKKLYGILILRCETNRKGQAGIVVHHAIAENGIDVSFSNILEESLWAYWAAFKNPKTGEQIFKWIRQESDRPALSRMLEKRYGKPIVEVFEKDLTKCEIHSSTLSFTNTMK